MTDQPSPPMGERRRRREAERRRAQETGEGLTPPMTRRERRALEEALASGALELTSDGQYAPTGELPVTTTGQHALSGTETAASAESADAEQQPSERAEPAQDAPPPKEPEPDAAEPETKTSSPEPPERQSWRDTALEVEALHPPPTMAPTPDGGGSGDRAGSPGSAGTGEQQVVPGQVSRRSLRQRREDSSPSQQEQPSERTATGRRPVIRPPASALGTRSVDGATGELTAIQRAIRDINAAPDEPVTDAVLHPVDTSSPEPEASPEETSSPEADSSPAVADSAEESSAAPTETSPASASPAGAVPADAGTTEVSPAVSSPTADSPAEEEDVDDSFDMSPRWPSVAAVAEQTAAPRPETPEGSQQAEAAPEAARSAGSAGSPVNADEPGQEPDPEDADELDEADEDDERHTPRLLQVLYWVVLVLAGVVLGLLVWRMATGDLFGDGDALAAASWMVLRQ